MTMESEIIMLNTIEKILSPSALFTIKVHSNKTGEETMLSTYLDDLQIGTTKAKIQGILSQH